MAAGDGSGNREAMMGGAPASAPAPAQNPFIAALMHLIASQGAQPTQPLYGTNGQGASPVPGDAATPALPPQTPLGPFQIPGFPWKIQLVPIGPDQQFGPQTGPGIGNRTTF